VPGERRSQLLSDKGESVVLCTRRPDLPAQIAQTHENERYLPGIQLAPELGCRTISERAVSAADLVVSPSPRTPNSAACSARCERCSPADVPIVSATRGHRKQSRSC
jgi:glycerol-3-phosphate dehydrogenase (NAD(P)+)